MAEPLLLAGEWRQGRGAISPSYFPADGSVTAEVSTASAEDADEAIETAHQAWPAWAALFPHQRASVLYKVSDLITSDLERLAQLQTRDNGKPLAETRGLVASAAGTCRYFAAACETLEEELTPARGTYLTMSIYEALGVVGAITPWNSPIASEMQKIAPALAAGNAVVVKPADATPLLALELGKLFEQAGLPKGLLSILPGRGSIAGDAIVRHPLVKKVSFTGGTLTGRSLAHLAAEKLMPISLELGGKSPTIVFEDCDLELTLQGVLYGIFSSTGQACIAGSRLFVQASIYDQFVTELVARTQRLRVGHPEDPTTQVGPLISAAHRNSVESYVKLGLDEGGTLLAGGKRPEGEQYAAGSYYLPTIIGGLSNQARTCQEEIFGPVLVVMPFKDESDLLAQANDSVFGLAAGVWTRDYQKAWRMARLLQAGTIWINTYKTFSVSAPFGGFKDSGLGREKGRQGIRAYQQQKSVYWGLNETPNAWAY